MKDNNPKEKFSDFDTAMYDEEVRQRWGNTHAYQESSRRVKNYKKEDWMRIRDEGNAWISKAIVLFDQKVAPEDPRSMDIAEETRLAIDRNFYPCSHEMHLCLGQMYISDQRFTEYYDKHRIGLAEWFYHAIRANTER